MEPIVYGRRHYLTRKVGRELTSNIWQVYWQATPISRKVLLSKEHFLADSAKCEGEDYVKKHGGNFSLRQI